MLAACPQDATLQAVRAISFRLLARFRKQLAVEEELPLESEDEAEDDEEVEEELEEESAQRDSIDTFRLSCLCTLQRVPDRLLVNK